jgi:hypothetical protein
LNCGANPDQSFLAGAADSLQWIQDNEPTIRTYLGKQLTECECRTHFREMSTHPFRLNDVTLLVYARPIRIVLYSGAVDLEYDCSGLPEGNLLGGHWLYVSVDEACQPGTPTLAELDLHQRAKRFLDFPIPKGAADFVDSVADQFIAKVAEVGRIRLHTELAELLTQAQDEVDRRMVGASPDVAGFLKCATGILTELSNVPQTKLEHIKVFIRVKHPAGKRMPFKQKLVFASDDRARFEGAGAFPSIELFDVSNLESDLQNGDAARFESVFAGRLANAAEWLGKQKPEVFAELRTAGFATDVLLCTVARMESGEVELELSADFVAQCQRLGFAIRFATNNSAAW